MRHRNIKNIQERKETVSHLLVDKNNRQQWARSALLKENELLFGEFGIGKGGFLHELSKRHPEVSFLGIDQYDTMVVIAAEKLLNRKNVSLSVLNLSEIQEVMEEDTLDGLYLNFSDPWPKNRHAKRRLTHRNFLDIYDYLLKEGSVIQFKTDSLSLFEFTLNEVMETRREAFDISLDLHNSSAYSENIMTEYEEKFSQKGRIMGIKIRSRKAGR